MENEWLFIFFILLYSITSNSRMNIRKIFSISEITITIKGTGSQYVLYSGFIYLQNETIINGIIQNKSLYQYPLNNDYNNITMRWAYKLKNCSYMFNNLQNIIAIDLSGFDSSELTNMKDMFYGCTSLTSINFHNFNTSSVTYMGFVFDTCTSLTSVDLSSFNTSNVLDMNAMFDDCHSLISIDLSHFDTSKVTDLNYMFYSNYNLKYVNLGNFNTSLVQNMVSMFSNCRSLLFLNMKSFKEKTGVSLGSMFNSIQKNVIYCINREIAPNIASAIGSYSQYNNCSNICFDDNYTFIQSLNICLIENKTDEIDIDSTIFNPIQTGYLEYISYSDYLNDSILKTIDKCAIYDYYIGLCNSNNSETSSNKEKDDFINMIQNDILSGNIKSILNITNGKAKDLTIKKDNVLFTISTSDNQNMNEHKNESTIKLGECENTLRLQYNISDNGTLIIFKMDIFEEGFLIPLIEYEVYNSETNQKLDMSFCNDSKISISIPVNIDEDNLFKYNTSSEYYNDICFHYTSEKGTDLSLNDRRNEFSDNNKSLCESNCQYDGYNNNTKKAQCECEIKIKLPLISEITINKDKLINDLVDIKNSINIKIIKCYKVLFSKDGIIYNIGSYIILFIILIYLISIFIFTFKGFNQFINKIIKSINKNNKSSNKIDTDNFNSKKNKNKKEKKEKKENRKSKININIDNNKKNNGKTNFPIKKPKRESAKNINFNAFNRINTFGEVNNNSRKSNSNLNFISSKDNNNKRKKSLILHLNKNHLNSKELTIKNKISFNDYEINSLLYEDALKYDKRTYIQLYLSLLRTKHSLIFAFYTSTNYNSKIIKICLFFFSFALYYTVNALFFNDSTLHKIYEDGGTFNFIYQIPKILYSSMICSIFDIIIRFFSLTEKNIIQMKREKKNIETNLKNLPKCLIIKFSLFFVISLIFLFFFWYYLACFCAIYRNTQTHLIKDTLISFGLSMIYPFGSNLFPGIFRILSLKKRNRECIYKFSQIMQLI